MPLFFAAIIQLSPVLPFVKTSACLNPIQKAPPKSGADEPGYSSASARACSWAALSSFRAD